MNGQVRKRLPLSAPLPSPLSEKRQRTKSPQVDASSAGNGRSVFPDGVLISCQNPNCASVLLIPRLLWDGGVSGPDRILARMTHQSEPLPWRAIVRGIIIVYGVIFLVGMLLAAFGITPKIDPGLYPLLALLVGGISVAVALHLTDTTRPACLVAIGIGIWLLSGTAVLFGAQSLAGWFESSLSIAATMFLGRLLLGTLNEPPVQSSYAPIIRSMPKTRRNM